MPGFAYGYAAAVSVLAFGSNEDWTRSQRIRTLAEIAFEVDLLETEEPPLYQQVAAKALHLTQLGLSKEAIARSLGVDGKTVAKALIWIMDHSAS